MRDDLAKGNQLHRIAELSKSLKIKNPLEGLKGVTVGQAQRVLKELKSREN